MQLVNAVQYLHSKLIIHRDIKAENIILTSDVQSIKLIDFGISKQLLSKEEKTKTWCGTPSMMAPEIVRGDPYSMLADVWSVGCLFCEHFFQRNDVFGFEQFTEEVRATLKQIRQMMKKALPSKADWMIEVRNNDKVSSTFAVQLNDPVRKFITNMMMIKPTSRLKLSEFATQEWIISNTPSELNHNE